MLEDPHYPSPKSVAAVFFVILLLMAGVFVWAFYLNYGTVVLTAEQPFSVTVNGKDYDCSAKICRIDLPPRSYEFMATSEGYSDDLFRMDILRAHEKKYEIPFELIPFLKEYAEQKLPEAPDRGYVLLPGQKEGVINLVRATDQAVITSFESLQNPTLQISGNLALVVDTGRIFFVNLADGSKLRRFDDSIEIVNAKLSDPGNRVLLFVRMKEKSGAEGREQLWIWRHDTQELSPLPWYEPPELAAWDIGVDHRIFLITDQFQTKEKNSLMEQVLNTPGLEKPTRKLFRYHLDTDEKKEIESVDASAANKIIRIGDRFFMTMADQQVQELVVK